VVAAAVDGSSGSGCGGGGGGGGGGRVDVRALKSNKDRVRRSLHVLTSAQTVGRSVS
jgi:3-oxoacyl-ACP reductase-like protein